MSRKIRWVRPHEEQWIPFTPWTRPYQMEMPVFRGDLSRIMDFEPSGEMALFMTLGLHAEQDEHIYRYEGFCKHAFYLVHQLISRTDITERRIPIFLCVTENGYPRFERYRAACQFPTAFVIPLSRDQHAFQGGPCAWHIKLEGFFTPQLMDYTRVFTIDTSLVYRVPPGTDASRTPLFREMLQRWHSPESQHIALHHALFHEKESVFCYQLQEHTPNVTFDDMLIQFASLIHSDVQTESAFWRTPPTYDVQGSIYGMSRDFRKRKQSRIRELMHLLPTDQMVICGALRDIRATSADVVEEVCKIDWWTFFKESSRPQFSYIPSAENEAACDEHMAFFSIEKEIYDEK